jgi:DNA-binding response OmpR family regulator
MKAAPMHLPILLLEDNADVRDLLVEAFSDNGAFAVHAAATISEAQTLVAEHGNSFAAAVLDVSLPDGDGRQFCADLRRQGFDLPVILLSGLSSEDDVVRGLEAGADDYLVKPFSIAELLGRVAAKLRHAAPHSRSGSRNRTGRIVRLVELTENADPA